MTRWYPISRLYAASLQINLHGFGFIRCQLLIIQGSTPPVREHSIGHYLERIPFTSQPHSLTSTMEYSPLHLCYPSVRYGLGHWILCFACWSVHTPHTLCFNIILQFAPINTKWSLPLKFSVRKMCTYLSSSPRVLHVIVFFLVNRRRFHELIFLILSYIFPVSSDIFIKIL